MIPALRHVQRLRVTFAGHALDQPMFAIDPARPPPAEVPAKWLGLARAAKGIAQAFLEEAVQAIEALRVFRLPIEIILPGGGP